MSTRAVVDLVIVFGVPIVGTGLWLLGVLTADAVCTRLRRHTGARLVVDPDTLHFANCAAVGDIDGTRWIAQCGCGWMDGRRYDNPWSAQGAWKRHVNV